MMKLWELASIMRWVECPEVLQSVASTRPEWSEFGAIYARFNNELPGRAVLDSVLPEDYVLAVLAASDAQCFRTPGGSIASWQTRPGDQPMSLVDVYKTYGGSILERIFERSSVEADELAKARELAKAIPEGDRRGDPRRGSPNQG